MINAAVVKEMLAKEAVKAKEAGVNWIEGSTEKGLPRGVAVRLRADFWLLYEFQVGGKIKAAGVYEVGTKKEALDWLKAICEGRLTHRIGKLPDGPYRLGDGTKFEVKDGEALIPEKRKAMIPPPAPESFVKALAPKEPVPTQIMREAREKGRKVQIIPKKKSEPKAGRAAAEELKPTRAKIKAVKEKLAKKEKAAKPAPAKKGQIPEIEGSKLERKDFPEILSTRLWYAKHRALQDGEAWVVVVRDGTQRSYAEKHIGKYPNASIILRVLPS